jgi:hypothetical protein
MGSKSAKRPGLKQAGYRLQEVFARPALRVLVLILALALFYWPFVSQVELWNGWALFDFLFGAWLGVIIILLGMGVSLNARERPRPTDEAGAGKR